MAIQQAGSCAVERRNGALVADLGLHQDQFILDKLSLRFQREEDGLTPQLIFALFCFEILLRKIARNSSSGLRVWPVPADERLGVPSRLMPCSTWRRR